MGLVFSYCQSLKTVNTRWPFCFGWDLLFYWITIPPQLILSIMASDSDKQKIVHIHLPKEENFTTTLTAGDHELRTDEPESVEGGKDRGPDPYDYLLMSLGSCTVMTIKMYVRRKDWSIDDVYMELRHSKRHAEDCDNCEDPKSRIDTIEKEVIVEGDLTEEQIDRILDISKKCPVHRTLMSDISIESSITHK